MLSARKRAALGDVSNRCFGRPAADALASFYKDADTSSLLLAPDIHLLILEHVGAPAYVVTAGVSKSWREAVLIKLRAAGVDCRADVADFCLGAVMDADFPYLQKAPCISSVGGTSWVKDRSAKARGGREAEVEA